MSRRALLCLSVIALGVVPGATAENTWQQAARAPEARTEVAAALVGNEIAVVGGYLADGTSSARVDLYSPRSNRWRRGQDLPVDVNHAAAAAFGGRLYVVGGYGPGGRLRSAYVLRGGAWRTLPALPEARAAAGAAVVAGKLYIVGGVTNTGLARAAYVLDLRRPRSWSQIPGPSAREHLAVAAAGGRVYALAGRTAGVDTNLRLFEEYRPGARAWKRLAPIPEARGGTDAAVSGSLLVSVGGEAPLGTVASVYAFDLRKRAWRRLADVPTPRHGLGVVAVGDRVYAIGGGPRPGLFVSDANEYLTLP